MKWVWYQHLSTHMELLIASAGAHPATSVIVINVHGYNKFNNEYSNNSQLPTTNRNNKYEIKVRFSSLSIQMRQMFGGKFIRHSKWSNSNDNFISDNKRQIHIRSSMGRQLQHDFSPVLFNNDIK